MTVCIKTEHGWRPWLAANTPSSNHNALQGVFKETTLEDARRETAAHAEHYVRCVSSFIEGHEPGSGSARYQAMWDRIRRYRLLDAYGEKL